MDLLEHYRSLARLGLDEFMRDAAPAALLRNRPGDTSGFPNEEEETFVGMDFEEAPDLKTERMVIHPLEKKKGAPFSDMITVGRTANNDVVLNDITVSRFHAYFKKRGEDWVVCDAGSKNGTQVNGRRLDARKERKIENGTTVRIGDIETMFHLRDDLFEIMLRA